MTENFGGPIEGELSPQQLEQLRHPFRSPPEPRYIGQRHDRESIRLQVSAELRTLCRRLNIQIGSSDGICVDFIDEKGHQRSLYLEDDYYGPNFEESPDAIP